MLNNVAVRHHSDSYLMWNVVMHLIDCMAASWLPSC